MPSDHVELDLERLRLFDRDHALVADLLQAVKASPLSWPCERAFRVCNITIDMGWSVDCVLATRAASQSKPLWCPCGHLRKYDSEF
jgi:hypothetical protein